MSMKDLMAKIPYIAWHEIDVIEEGPETFRMGLRFRKEVQNHVGSMHGGALFTLAETVAGVAANTFAVGVGGIILMRDAEVRFTRRGMGDVEAVTVITEETAKTARANFSEVGKTDLSVAVTTTDTEGETVFEGVFNYAIRPRKS